MTKDTIETAVTPSRIIFVGNWAFIKTRLAELQVNHKDGNPLNNELSNLEMQPKPVRWDSRAPTEADPDAPDWARRKS